MGKLGIARLIGYLLLHSGTTAGLASDRLRANDLIALGIDAHFVDLLDAAVLSDLVRSGHLGPLRRCLLQAASVACGALRIHSVLAGH